MTDSNTILSADVLAAINAPIERARGLPAAAYTQQSFFDAEQRQLFPQTWMGVAFDTDLPQIGDARPLTVCGVPLVLVRAAAKEIRAFHNVCRHRATLVLTEPASGLKNLQCPYHAWTYGLDGSLLATPFWDGTASANRCPVDPEHNGLVPVACTVWKHVVYINLDGKAPGLDEYGSLFEREFGHLDLDGLGLLHRRAWDFAANWKLVMDNWEVYHHVWVHEGVFDRMSDEVDLGTGVPYTDSIAEGNVMVLKGKPERPAACAAGYRTPAVDSFLRRSATALGCRQCVAAQRHADRHGNGLRSRHLCFPSHPVSRAPKMAWYVVPEAIDSQQHEAAREALLSRWLGSSRDYADRAGIRSQDHSCMEWQQAARGSPVADSVQYSPTWEADVHYFQRWFAARMTGSDLPPPLY